MPAKAHAKVLAPLMRAGYTRVNFCTRGHGHPLCTSMREGIASMGSEYVGKHFAKQGGGTLAATEPPTRRFGMVMKVFGVLSIISGVQNVVVYAIAVLLLLAADSTGALAAPFAMHHLTYCNSGDSPYGGKDQVVGYHAFALTATVSSQHDGRGSSQTADKDKDQEDFLSAADKEQLLNVAWNAIAPARLHRVVTPTAVFARKLGVFVTLTEGGRLRGCIGHFGEDIPLGDITQEMAHAAAFEDPRFPSLSEDELDGIDIELSVLTPLQRIHDVEEFHYGRQGIYMRKGWRSGTFLPQVAEEVNWTKEEFLGHCAQDKAGIGWDGWKTAELYTYEAVRFHKKF